MEGDRDLSGAEWALVVELLEQELRELPVEIHHTQTSDYRHDLIARRRLIQGLLDRLKHVAVG